MLQNLQQLLLTGKSIRKKVQNKIHYAVHGQTAAEVIYTRADAEKEFMGLTTFAGSQPTLKEAFVAKNYLDEKELRAMGQLVSGYLDFAERQQTMTMQDWSVHRSIADKIKASIFDDSFQRITVLTIVPLFYLLEIQTMRELKKQYSDINSRMPLQSCRRLYQLGD